MKKTSFLFSLLFFAQLYVAQYLIVGKDSISAENFKKDNTYSLENNGIDKTIKSIQEFMLLQQFAAEKKSDTMSYFKAKYAKREGDLIDKNFMPNSITDPLLANYLKDNLTERKVLLFALEKTIDDKTDYTLVYNDVKSGKMTMEDAIKKYIKGAAETVYLKPGIIDNEMYSEITKTTVGSLTPLVNTSTNVVFAKLVANRPSMGYVVFNTLSFPKDENAEKMKKNIYAALKSGKKFPEVVKQFGTTESEKKYGGMVVGSPTFPDDIYNALKGKKIGEYTTEPILVGDKYFVFGIYDIMPYNAMTEKNKPFFLKEMMSSTYGEMAYKKLLEIIKKEGNYKEFPDYLTAKKSLAMLNSLKNDAATLYQYKTQKITVGDLKKQVTVLKDVEKATPLQWIDLLQSENAQSILDAYSRDILNTQANKEELLNLKKNLYSEYIFSEYLKNEVEKNPQWTAAYYNKHKDKYVWETRAKGRVAIIADDSLIPTIQKDIVDDKNWEALIKKYDGKLNSKNQILVAFQSGEMDKKADVFTKYKVPFEKGVHTTKISERSLVIAVDDILPQAQMTLAEAESSLKDAVIGEKLQETIETQRAKTKITVQPEFIKALEKNFKK